MDTPDTNPKLGKMVIEVVRNQIRDNDPPETRQTFERLKAEGHSADEARRLISGAVTVEIFHIMRDHQEFNRERFVWNLSRLPQEPWDKDGKEYYEG
jgi:hypothetical protein